MNIKEYIDCFDEISSLPREQQFQLLEQAKNEIISNSMINTFTVISCTLPLVFILSISALFYIFMGYSIGLLVTSIFLGLLTSRIAINEINTSLILKKIKEITARKSD
jgi:hypothetical protein